MDGAEIGPGVVLIGAVFGGMWAPFAVAVNRLLRPPASGPGALAALIVVPSTWLIPEWIRSYQGLGGPRDYTARPSGSIRPYWRSPPSAERGW